jgi:hypothetical protein
MDLRPIRRLAVAVALVPLTLTLAPAGPADAGTAEDEGTSWGAGFGSSLIRSDAEVAANRQAWRGGTVVLQAWQTDDLARLKERNPDLTVLMYKNMSATYRDTCRDGCTRDSPVVPGGVGYHWAQDHHPEWFLRDEGGTALEWADWRGLFPMDSSSAAYQRTWAANVRAELEQHPWDGVMVDDTLTWRSHPVVGGRVPTRLATDEEQYAATRAFLQAVGPDLEQAGWLVVPNITLSWDNWRDALAELSPYVSGWENEHFTMWGRDGSEGRFADTDDWTWKVQMAEWLADRDLPLLAITYSTPDDRAAMRYHRATWLLTWNGRTGASIFVSTDESVAQDQRAATEDVGLPTGPREEVDGVWRRPYSDGLVLVNPTYTVKVVRVGPGYEVDRVRLGPLTGRVLQEANG